jgi:site-specific DNA-methyltransferase (adenine-specific)
MSYLGSFSVTSDLRLKIEKALATDGAVILPPMDTLDSLGLLQLEGFYAQCVMLDPWYNKGVGGVTSDYDQFITQLLAAAAPVGDHIYLWGFPEIIANFMNRWPSELQLVAWLTWYYKNNPSVIRGWRSAQMTCLHLSKVSAKLYPEHFLNEKQKEKQRQGKLRYMPGPPSVLDGDFGPGEELHLPADVIEYPLNIGFVGRSEQTGHPAQKPIRVYEPLVQMVTQPGDLVIDPMAGSGTAGVVGRAEGNRVILCDMSEEYTQIMEKRLGVLRLEL